MSEKTLSDSEVLEELITWIRSKIKNPKELNRGNYSRFLDKIHLLKGEFTLKKTADSHVLKCSKCGYDMRFTRFIYDGPKKDGYYKCINPDCDEYMHFKNATNGAPR